VDVFVDLGGIASLEFLPTGPGDTLYASLPVPSDAQLVGLTFVGQFGLFEPPGCAPAGISASTAVAFTIQQ